MSTQLVSFVLVILFIYLARVMFDIVVIVLGAG